MDFAGPQAADYANVRTLNRAFLNYLKHDSDGAQLCAQLPRSMQDRFANLDDNALGRLADAPFLLLSFRERDMARWQALTVASVNEQLLMPTRSAGAGAQLMAAGIGFLWQLVQRNPYAARLITGATLDWCERLSQSMLLELCLLYTSPSPRDS